MSYIELEVIWSDDDGMIQVELTASNGAQVGKQDFYAYPEQLLEFGEKLSSFPSSMKDVVVLEYGEDPKYYCHMLLRATVIANTGASAIEIKFENRLQPPMEAQVRFFIASEPASLNKLGKSLINWARLPSGKFRAEFST